MRVMLKPLFLVLTPLAVWPAWHSCRGQDSTAQESGQQPQQVSSQKPVATSPNTNPSSQSTTTPPPGTTSPSSSLDDTINAGETDDDIRHAPREMARWNEYRGPHFTAKAGIGFLVDAAGYARDTASKEQIMMLPAQRLRDFRFVLGNSFPSLPRRVTWNVGIMYDAPTHSWLIRQTGVMVGRVGGLPRKGMWRRTEAGVDRVESSS
jgi:hypothetical protein